MTGETQHGLRGDYSRIRTDYTVDQEWDAYTPGQHELWRDQAPLLTPIAILEFRPTRWVSRAGTVI